MTQWIVVDDTDSAITYNTAAQWSAVNNSIPGTVDLDNAIFQTGHVLSSNGSLSFSFTGTDVEVFGVSSKLSSETHDMFELSWTCSIDNITIPSNRAALDGFPWMSYCSQAGMNNDSHILHVNVSAKESSQFWLDYIRYVPLSGSLPENQTILVDSTDPTIQYGTGWETLGTAKVTENEPLLQNPNLPPGTDNMTFTFSGTGITWYSLTLQAIMQTDNKLPGAFPQEAGSALITLDGEPRNVTIPINGSSDDPSYDMPLFHYDGLDPSTEHVLTATYQADASGMRTPPLTLDFLLVQTGPEPAADSSSPGVMSPSASAGVSSAAPNPTSASQALSEKSHPVRASTIAGAVLGPLVFVLAALLAVCYWRQRRQRARTARRAMTHRAAKLAFPRERAAPSLDDDDSQPADSESYAMHTSESAHDYARAGLASPGALAGSRFVEDSGAPAAAAQRPFTPRRHSVDYPWETVHAPVPVPASAGAQSVLVDYSGREALQGPSSTSSVTNPFRRMNLASPSNGSFSTLSYTTSNPFRGGPLTPSAQRGG